MSVLFTSLVTMVVAQLFDLGTFVTMVRRIGPAAESNPLVAGALASDGLPTLVIGKLVLMLFIACLSVVLATRGRALDRRLGAVVLGVSIVAGLVGGGSNAIVIGRL